MSNRSCRFVSLLAVAASLACLVVRSEIPDATKDPSAHWAFQPPIRHAIPTVSKSDWPYNPIDSFIGEQHALHGLTPQPATSKSVLLRRLYLDLIGLPPTR